MGLADRLSHIDWESLTHAYGSAVDVPDLVLALTSHDESTRENALYELCGNIFHQGTRYEASKYAVPFLFDLVASSGTPDRHGIVGFLTALAIGYDESWLPEGMAIQEYRSALTHAAGDDALYLRWELDAYDAVREGVPILRDRLVEGEPDLATWAAYALAWFPEEREHTIPALEVLLASAPPPSTAATALIALGLLGGPPSLFVHSLDSEDAVVRIGAAIALARTQPDDLPHRALVELIGAGSGCVPDPTLPFLFGDLGGYAALSLSRLPAETADRAVDALSVGLEGVTFPNAATRVQALLALAFKEPIAIGVGFDELTSLQQRAIVTIANARRAWMPREDTYDGNFAAVVGSYGFPTKLNELRLFAGLSPISGS